jgi:hypothetical protein
MCAVKQSPSQENSLSLTARDVSRGRAGRNHKMDFWNKNLFKYHTVDSIARIDAFSLYLVAKIQFLRAFADAFRSFHVDVSGQFGRRACLVCRGAAKPVERGVLQI